MKDIILQPKNRFTWSLLAFQGGFVNIGGLLTVHMFVSHITGFPAQFSLELIDANYLKTLYFVLVPIFFLLGSFSCSLVSEIRHSKNLPPVYIHILLSLGALYAILSVMGQMQFLGSFGEPFENFHDFVILSLLAYSCGVQNALVTNYSGSIIRTTHLTGITTDLGIGLARRLISKKSPEGKINLVRIELISSFIAGSLIGAFVFPEIHFLAFLIPSLISCLVGIRLYSPRT